jgi:hypothetical protein
MLEAQKQGRNVVVVWGESIHTISYLDEYYAIVSYVAVDENYIYCYYIWEDGSIENWDSDYSRRGITVYLYSDGEGNYSPTYYSEEIYRGVQNGCSVSLEVQDWDGTIFNLSYCAPDVAVFTAIQPDCSEVYSYYIYQDGTVEYYDSWWTNDITLSYNDLSEKPFYTEGTEVVENSVNIANNTRTGSFLLHKDEEYYITYDDTEYVLTAKMDIAHHKTQGSYGYRLYVGNATLLGAATNMYIKNAVDTGESFLIISDGVDATNPRAGRHTFYTTDSNSHNIKVEYFPETAKIYKLPERYLPNSVVKVAELNSYATKEYLEEYVNNAILNGEW